MKLIEPLPLPLVLPVIVNHDDALLDADQLHPFGAVTEVDPDCPAAATDWLVGVSVNVHAAAA